MVNKEYFGEGKISNLKERFPAIMRNFLKILLRFPIVPADRLF